MAALFLARRRRLAIASHFFHFPLIRSQTVNRRESRFWHSRASGRGGPATGLLRSSGDMSGFRIAENAVLSCRACGTGIVSRRGTASSFLPNAAGLRWTGFGSLPVRSGTRRVYPVAFSLHRLATSSAGSGGAWSSWESALLTLAPPSLINLSPGTQPRYCAARRRLRPRLPPHRRAAGRMCCPVCLYR